MRRHTTATILAEQTQVNHPGSAKQPSTSWDEEQKVMFADLANRTNARSGE